MKTMTDSTKRTLTIQYMNGIKSALLAQLGTDISPTAFMSINAEIVLLNELIQWLESGSEK